MTLIDRIRKLVRKEEPDRQPRKGRLSITNDSTPFVQAVDWPDDMIEEFNSSMKG